MAIKTPAIVDNKAVLAQIEEQIRALEALQPHVNTAIQAFGDPNGLAAQITELKNKLAKAKAAYSV